MTEVIHKPIAKKAVIIPITNTVVCVTCPCTCGKHMFRKVIAGKQWGKPFPPLVA